MSRRLVSVILTLVLVSVFSMTFKVQTVEGIGPIYIRPDGTVEPSTAPIQRVGYVYTLIDNIYEGIVIQRSNIVFDGAGYTLQGSGSGYGFQLYGINNVAVQNLTIKSFSRGICVDSSSNITLFGNVINSSRFGFGVFGSELAHFKHAISDSNLVDGKPIHYLVNQTDLVINPVTYPKVGFLALVNCFNATIEGLTLSNVEQGLLLAYTNNTRITNNNLTNNSIGIWLHTTSNITISKNNVTANNEYGIKFSHSSNSIIDLNEITNNGHDRYQSCCGVYLVLSSNNTISGNNITKNSNYDVWFSNSSNNIISGNSFEYIQLDMDSDSNVISGNSAIKTVVFSSSDCNIIAGHEIDSLGLSSGASHNTISENHISYLTLTKSHYNNISANIISNTGLKLVNSAWNNISRNQIDNCRRFAMDILGDHNIISENNITGSGSGIYIRSGSDHNLISGNNITKGQGYDRLGILLYGHATSNIISGNIITDHDKGIKLQEYWASDNLITSNFIANNTDAVYFGIASLNNVIAFNTIINNSGNGIDFLQCKNNTIFGNTITNNGDYGIRFSTCSGNLVSNNEIINNNEGGIDFSWCQKNTLFENTIVNSGNHGIKFSECQGNTVSRNTIRDNYIGVWLESSSKNILSGNIVADNWDGVGIHLSSNNTLYHNNFIRNTRQAYIQTLDSTNFWNHSYPSGGNYWSNYKGTDLDNDGLSDTPYIMDTDNIDNHPLMGMFSDFNATSEQHIQTICNSTISGFQFNGTEIKFTISGQNGTTGFCRICIPKALMGEAYRIFINGTEISHTLLTDISNNSHSYLYFTYLHSTQELVIIPKLLSPFIQPIFIAAIVIGVIIILSTLLGATIYKRKHHKPINPAPSKV